MGKQPLRLPFQFTEAPEHTQREIVYHSAADGYPLTGVLYLPPKSGRDVALLAMHPRGDFSRHYLAPLCADGGYAFFGATTRYLNHDVDMLHERLLLDVAGSIAWLHERGFKRVVLMGNSGGGSLFAFYLQQASLAPRERIAVGPAGDKTHLEKYELPTAEGLFLLAAHPGQGRFLLDRLDPSVTDENDPLSRDAQLDMYDPRNGYQPMMAGESTYSDDFIERFRAGQRERCARLDQLCRQWCDEAQRHRAQMKTPEFFAADLDAKLDTSRRALTRPYLIVYRTLADPRYLQLTLDRNQRELGSIFSFGRDPIAGNYGEGLARSMSARGWLSTWSGLSSNASLERTLPSVTCPVHICNALADTDIYPSDAERAARQVGSADVSTSDLLWADHYLNPVGEAGAALADPRVRCAEEFLLPWLRQRWS